VLTDFVVLFNKFSDKLSLILFAFAIEILINLLHFNRMIILQRPIVRLSDMSMIVGLSFIEYLVVRSNPRAGKLEMPESGLYHFVVYSLYDEIMKSTIILL